MDGTKQGPDDAPVDQPAEWPDRPQRPGNRLEEALGAARHGMAQPVEAHAADEPPPEASLAPRAPEAEQPEPGYSPGREPVPDYETLLAMERAARRRTVATEEELLPGRHHSPAPVSRPSVVVDLRPKREQPTVPAVDPYGLGSDWGSEWERSAQGWVGKDSANPVWRPVVTTTEELPDWEVDTYLGVVTAEVAVEARSSDLLQLGETLARGRDMALEGLVEEAVSRGSHAVLAVKLGYTTMGDRLLITVTGTAVTLREKA